MKASTLTSSAAIPLASLRWVAFSQDAGATYAPLSASFTPENVAVVSLDGSPAYPTRGYRFSNAAALPAWLQAGVGLKIAASVTIGGKSYDLSGYYVVRSVAADGLSFDVNAPSPNGTRDAVAITQALAATALDSGAGGTVTPLVALVMQCQKAMFKANSGTCVIAPVVDASGSAPFEITLDSTTGEYELAAQPGSKFDLADWSLKFSGAGTLGVRFK